MNKAFSLFKTGLKYTSITLGFGSLFGFGYLQYVNSILGPVDIDKADALSFYKEHHKMTDSEASRTYYWVLFHICFARISNFSHYQSYCKKLNNKIVDPPPNNYKNLYPEIVAAKDTKPTRVNRNIFNQIVDIRKVNGENIDTREYIIKEIRSLQKELYTNMLFNIPDESREKISKLHSYICEMGKSLRDPEILRYINKLPEIERKYPKDFLYKILFI